MIELMETITMLPVVSLLLFFIEIQVLICKTDVGFIGCLDAERKALIDFRAGLEDPENRLSSWEGRDCCQWRGVHCSNTTGAVIFLDLHNPHPSDDSGSSGRYGFWNLSGEIRPSLKMLKSLKHLDLSFNTFNFIQIPEFFGSLKYLQYLNLSNAEFSGAIPPNLGNLSSLQYLDASYKFGFTLLSVDNLDWVCGIVSLEYLNMNGADLSMVGSDWIAKLNNLPALTELHLSSCGLSGFVPSLTVINFTSLAVIELDYNNLNSEIPYWLVNISSLVTVSMRFCGLYGRIPLGFRDLPRLKFLDLSANRNLTANCFEFFTGRWKNLRDIDLSSNNLHGELPASIGNITALTYFDLSDNNVEGGIPSSIGKLCNLAVFSLKSNNLTGTIPEVLRTGNCISRTPLPSLQSLDLGDNQLAGNLPEWLGQLESLVELYLFNNSINGPIPASLGSLPNISELNLGYNKLTGTLPDSLGKLSELSLLDVESNHLTGIVTETHFQDLNKLKFLYLSSNSLVLNVSSNWVPPFQVQTLSLGSCHLGPSFPAWLKSQKKVEVLDFSNASISGSLPNWFWEISSKLSVLNISTNQLVGQLPNPLNVGPYAHISFRGNFFEGPIPLPVVHVELLDLSKNKFSGSIPKNIGDAIPSLIFLSLSGNQLTGEIPASVGKIQYLFAIDFSSNLLSGSIPYSIGNCSSLAVLDLSKNKLSGSIPRSFGRLNLLQTLHLSDNKLSGELPQALQNLSSLETLDLGNNSLIGTIPAWIGKYFDLRILKLRSNSFFGELPIVLSNLSSLYVLDLAENQLNGSIPVGFGDFKAMAQVQNTNHYLFYQLTFSSLYYEESLVVNLKGSSQTYTKTLSLVISMDLSGNELSGALPEHLTKLSGLVVLNLSRNHISGHIPESISNLKQLESLDFASNRLSGPIPQSLPSLSFLGYLNLSNNDFSGKIPYTAHLTTFDASSFGRNTGLCGDPLVVTCPGDEDSGKGITMENNDGGGDDDLIDKWFYLSVGLGFAAGILVPFFILVIRKSWCDAYFHFVDEVLERIKECHA